MTNTLTDKAEFKGNDVYTINCTGDVCVGDAVCFERAVFGGNYWKPYFEGYERIEAVVIKDSYGKDKQQHTFTLQKTDGSTFRIKGRNLYKEGTYRKPWEDESQRKIVLEEKHKRGDAAARAKYIRKNEECYI
ncbi:MAG: hypothetical protein VKL60_15265 [Sphaerospermopsis sp.]|nr:hypothetical protein [Sphaerospermopsis sp.]